MRKLKLQKGIGVMVHRIAKDKRETRNLLLYPIGNRLCKQEYRLVRFLRLRKATFLP